jgi:hypothetical protein
MLAGNKLNKLLLLFLSATVAGKATAQVSMLDEEKRGSIYISIGQNTPTFKASTINIEQGSAGVVSSYTLDKVAADNKSTSAASGLGTNIKIGYFFDYKQTFAVELSYEPVKYHVTDAQKVSMSGTLDNRTIDTTIVFSAANGYFYNLDGSNLISLNLVKRFQLLQNKKHTFRFDALAKGGGGPLMPHTFNSIANKVSEHPSFQFGGWNAGLEAALRLTIMRYVFVEGGYKYSWASYSDVSVYNGTASQKLTISQVIISAGITFPTTKRNPLFTKPDNKRPPLSIKPIYPEPIENDL